MRKFMITLFIAIVCLSRQSFGQNPETTIPALVERDEKPCDLALAPLSFRYEKLSDNDFVLTLTLTTYEDVDNLMKSLKFSTASPKPVQKIWWLQGLLTGDQTHLSESGVLRSYYQNLWRYYTPYFRENRNPAETTFTAYETHTFQRKPDGLFTHTITETAEAISVDELDPRALKVVEALLVRDIYTREPGKENSYSFELRIETRGDLSLVREFVSTLGNLTGVEAVKKLSQSLP